MIAAILILGAALPFSNTPTFQVQMCGYSRSGIASQAQYGWSQALDAIRRVETGGCPNEGRGAKGDYRTVDGKRVAMARGPFQIWKPYWTDSAARDATVRAGSYAQCLSDLDYSRLVVRAYMRRYCPTQMKRLESGCGTLVDLEQVARVHNGGPSQRFPNSKRRKATDGYWAKVKKEATR